MNQRQVFVSPAGERISFPAPPAPIDSDAAREVWTSALCAEVDPELFVEGYGKDAKAAKQICAGCEVRALCLDTFGPAIEYGVVGGLTGRERRALRRTNRRAA
jgi:WhiB family redox-sensing transcriptional regulator